MEDRKVALKEVPISGKVSSRERKILRSVLLLEFIEEQWLLGLKRAVFHSNLVTESKQCCPHDNGFRDNKDIRFFLYCYREFFWQACRH